jgi:hypothetical protein
MVKDLEFSTGVTTVCVCACMRVCVRTIMCRLDKESQVMQFQAVMAINCQALTRPGKGVM